MLVVPQDSSKQADRDRQREQQQQRQTDKRSSFCNKLTMSGNKKGQPLKWRWSASQPAGRQDEELPAQSQEAYFIERVRPRLIVRREDQSMGHWQLAVRRYPGNSLFAMSLLEGMPALMGTRTGRQDNPACLQQASRQLSDDLIVGSRIAINKIC